MLLTARPRRPAGTRARVVGPALGALLVVVATVGVGSPAAANSVIERGASEARAEAWGLHAAEADLGPLPEPVVAEIPPGESDRDAGAVGEVPGEPLVSAAAVRGEAEVHTLAEHRAAMMGVVDEASDADLPGNWTARGHAAAEQLEALFVQGGELSLFDAGGGQLSADAAEAEALAVCRMGRARFATAAQIQRLRVADDADGLGQVLDRAVELVVAGEPNEDVLANTPGGEQLADLGLELTAWETNWDGADGTTDGGDTVWVNALRLEVAEGTELAEAVGAQEVTVGHAQAEVDCAPPLYPLTLTKEVSADTVAPGEVFTYTLTVSNDDPLCTAEDVGVSDHIDGPAGSRIVATDPPADDVDEDRDDLHVRWHDLGPLAPGEQVTVTADVAVADDAADGAVYDEFAAVGGWCEGDPLDSALPARGPRVADDEPVEPAADTPEPAEPAADEPVEPAADTPEPAGPSTETAGPGRAVAEGESLPATGGGGDPLTAGLLVLAGGALAAARYSLRLSRADRSAHR